jgi:hypothetical protein
MSEFERFKKGLAEGRKHAFVKYASAMKGGGTEHVWGVAHAIQGDHVIVSLASEPVQEIAEHESRDLRVNVPIAKVEDWMLAGQDGKCEGGYSNLGLAKI